MNLLNQYNFFFELPLYTKIRLDTSNIEDFYNLMTSNKPFDAYNPILKQETTYQISRIPSHSVSPTQINKLFAYEGIKDFEIRCVRNGFTIKIYVYVFYVIIEKDDDELKDYYFMKIGQNPSIADLHISKIKNYDKVLPKEKLKEITKAIGLAANGVGIGSFVYLRRVFEFLIEEAHSKAKNDTAWDEDLYIKGRMAEKIDQLKHHLPSFLVENRGMYSILSLGIHELDENECLKHFDALKVGIEFILDEKAEQLIKAQKIEEAKRRIQNIGQQVTKK